jgi:hypothetical protein
MDSAMTDRERSAVVNDVAGYRVCLAVMSREISSLEKIGTAHVGRSAAATIRGASQEASFHEGAARWYAAEVRACRVHRANLLSVVREMEDDLCGV